MALKAAPKESFFNRPFLERYLADREASLRDRRVQLDRLGATIRDARTEAERAKQDEARLRPILGHPSPDASPREVALDEQGLIGTEMAAYRAQQRVAELAERLAQDRHILDMSAEQLQRDQKSFANADPSIYWFREGDFTGKGGFPQK